ncbi:TMM40 protein, partial [Bucco capensis]|nr:TMM40 protein [Bucco capensis]
DIFQRDFIADASYLENHEKMNQSFWESLVKCLATTDPPILTTEEKNNLLNSCSVPPGGCAAFLKAIEKEGVRAMAILYLLLKTTNPSGYRQLPSSTGKDEKLKLLKRLERNLMLSKEEEKAENSSHASTDEDPQGNQQTKKGKTSALNTSLAIWLKSQLWQYNGEKPESGQLCSQLAESTILSIKPLKISCSYIFPLSISDEFFHFVILCFAIGALLICYYHYKDWTISLGIGLVTFASLETTGIYFGLVYRIRSVLDSFIPLIDKLRPRGNSDLL